MAMAVAVSGTTELGSAAESMRNYNGVEIFSATMAQDRAKLGGKVSAWVRSHPECQIIDTVVTQSSDAAFHCIAITLFYHEPL